MEINNLLYAEATKTTNFLPIVYIVLGVLVFVAVIIVIIGVKNHDKKSKEKGFIRVDQQFVDQLIGYYGGIENIINVAVDNARLTIEVKNLQLVDLESIRANSNGGVFVKFNTIKTLYKMDSSAIKHMIEVKR